MVRSLLPHAQLPSPDEICLKQAPRVALKVGEIPKGSISKQRLDKGKSNVVAGQPALSSPLVMGVGSK